MKNISEMLKSVSSAHPSKTAVVDSGETVSFSELDRQVGALAADLQQHGISPGDSIAILLPNSIEFVLSYFGITRAGAIIVPFNDSYQKNEIRYLLNECGIRLIITDRRHLHICESVLEAGEGREILIIEDWRSESAARDLAPAPIPTDLDDPVMYQFSSGSTGAPKKIARTHRNVLFELDSFVRTMGFSSEDRFIGVAPFSHVNGLMRSMMTSLRSGASLYPLAQFDRQRVAETIEQQRITVFIAVPFMFGMLAKTRFKEIPDFSSLRFCISASAPMPEAINREFEDKFGIFVRQLYGSTETGTISVDLSSDPGKSLKSVGTPIHGVEVEVFDESSRPIPQGDLGEFAVKSPAAISRYEGLEQVNRKSFKRGFFLTGDLGRRKDDGLLYLEGRKKFFINKGGYKINPQDIEEVLLEHRSVEEAAVVGVATTFEDEKVKAVVVLKNPCSEGELIEFCRGRIADFKIPSLIEFRDELPKTSTGKIRKKMLI